jgi:hypothetical protein
MNGMKSQSPAPSPPASSRTSGKLVIVAILLVCFWVAAAGWYFRYEATHRPVKFWGPEAAILIRDAPRVTVHRGPFSGSSPATIQTSFDASKIDVSHAHGLAHLRNALLEDRNFDWTTADKPLPFWPSDVDMMRWWLTFDDPSTGKSVTIWLSDDFHWASRSDDEHHGHAISTAPMAAGLREMFEEFSSKSAPDAANQSR